MLVLTVLIAGLISLAPADNSEVSLEGVVISYNEKIIELKQTTGAVIRIPRSAKPKLNGVVVGKDVLKVKVSSKDFLIYNKEIFNTPKKVDKK